MLPSDVDAIDAIGAISPNNARYTGRKAALRVLGLAVSTILYSISKNHFFRIQSAQSRRSCTMYLPATQRNRAAIAPPPAREASDVCPSAPPKASHSEAEYAASRACKNRSSHGFLHWWRPIPSKDIYLKPTTDKQCSWSTAVLLHQHPQAVIGQERSVQKSPPCGHSLPRLQPARYAASTTSLRFGTLPFKLDQSVL